MNQPMLDKGYIYLLTFEAKTTIAPLLVKTIEQACRIMRKYYREESNWTLTNITNGNKTRVQN